MSYIIDGDRLLHKLDNERLVYPYNVITEGRIKEKLKSIIYSLPEQCERCSKRCKDHCEKEDSNE